MKKIRAGVVLAMTNSMFLGGNLIGCHLTPYYVEQLLELNKRFIE